MPQIDVAVATRDGARRIVNVGRPGLLIAFADKFGKTAPEPPHIMRELAWLVHHELKVEQPLDEWVETLVELTDNQEDVARLRDEWEPDPREAVDGTGPPPPAVTGLLGS
jgi:hypothetical protein